MKLNKKLSRKDFFKFGALLVGAPIISTVASSCSKITESGEPEITQRIDRAISESPSFKVQKPLAKTNGSNVYKIPLSAFNSGSDKHALITRILPEQNYFNLQTISVKIVEKDNYFAWVMGLNEGDVLLINPKETLNMLAGIDRVELRNRFIRAKRT